MSHVKRKPTIHINTAMNSLSRRDFLKLLSGTAGAIALSPLRKLNLGDSVAIDVPPTLMLHSKDFVKLVTILKWLNAEGYHSLNYRDFAKVISGEQTLPDKPVILTIDDINTDYIFNQFMRMFDMVERAGYLGILGLVTRKNVAERPNTWSALRELAGRGWEMENHSVNHPVLPSLSDKDLRTEILDATKMIQDGIGESPLSLIVPYANVHNHKGVLDQRIFSISAEAQLEFVVGMAQGRHLTPGQPPYYLGRIGTGVDSVQTGRWIVHFNDDTEQIGGASE